ncbi:MAG: energy-coupling factor transporter ATPase [Clostridium sp.]|jgi:energy-coupling factor transport system ATP-binding protein|nr:energy-coupling factor transporter ATPase [Clostridium sp.]MDY5895200.1 energy-coupling factor transporter ATPase [Oscillospiraceae bacterium]
MTHAIETIGLTHYYSKGTVQQVAAINDVNLTIEKGELVGVIGHTGSGKSTLISHFNGLLKPDAGKVLVDGTDIWKDKETLRNTRFKVGLCFQYPEYQLFEETVFKDIAFGPKNMKLSEAEVKERVLRAAEFVGVKTEHLDKSPFDLSGGEKRRVAIAGVMSMEPEVLIFDEPAAGLDPQGRRELIKLIKDYREQTGSAVVVVSHSMEDIASLADKVIVMNNSRIEMQGTVDEVYSRGEELRRIGLNIPEITEIFLRLRARGFDVPANVYTVEQGAAILKALASGRRGK